MKGNLETTSLFVAAFLNVKGFRVKGTASRGAGNFISFVFDEEARNCMAEYFKGGDIEARRFVEAYITLRRMAKEEKFNAERMVEDDREYGDENEPA